MTTNTLLNVNEIQNYLAHRYPFLLIDRVTECIEGESIKGYKNLTINEEVFQGHFPGEPIFPGVMIIEAMAQLSGVLGFRTMGVTRNEQLHYLLAGVDKVRFKKRSVPGDRLDMEARLVVQKRNTWKFETTVSVDGELIAGATLLCVVADLDNS